VFEDLVAQGGLGMRTLALRGASPLEGGIPLIADGKIIGAIGVSGATSVQDSPSTHRRAERKDSLYPRLGRSSDWLKSKNPACAGCS
jgi:hypothetical protein